MGGSVNGVSRQAHYRACPSQIRTCGFSASGSLWNYLIHCSNVDIVPHGREREDSTPLSTSLHRLLIHGFTDTIRPSDFPQIVCLSPFQVVRHTTYTLCPIHITSG